MADSVIRWAIDMVEILVSAATALLHVMAILGYVTFLFVLASSANETNLNLLFRKFLTVILWIAGVGTLFVIPAYLYGKFKGSITDSMISVFFAFEILALIALFFAVRSLNRKYLTRKVGPT